MKAFNKAVKSGLMAVALATGGGVMTAAPAQAQLSDPRILDSELRIKHADYRADLASCDSNFASYRFELRRLNVATAERQSCRARAATNYTERTYNIYLSAGRYGEARQTLNEAFNARQQYDRAEYNAARARCNYYAYGSGNNRDFFRTQAELSRCNAQAESTYIRNQAWTERNYLNNEQNLIRLSARR